jgi:hypothetical protein
MVGFRLGKIETDAGKVLTAVQKGTSRALRIAAYAIMRTAQASIEEKEGPSTPGEPPHTHPNLLKKSIKYDVDVTQELAVVGTRESIVGDVGEVHEFGDRRHNHPSDPWHPARPFMAPALEANRELIPAFWQDEVTN